MCPASPDNIRATLLLPACIKAVMPKRNARGQFVKSKRRRAPAKKAARRAPRRSIMPRRKSTKRRSSGRGGFFGGAKSKLMTVAVGAAGGIAAKLGGGFNAQFGPAIGMGAVGYFAHNDTLLTLAGMSASNMIPLPGGSTGGSGGWY